MAIEEVTKASETISEGWNKYNATAAALVIEHASTGAHGVITATSLNALTLTAATTGFTIAGGTTSKTLTLNANLTASYLADITSAEADQIEAIGTTTISAAQWGYLGALTTPPLGGDATAGRKLRGVYLKVENGTNDNTLKCTVTNQWNGDVIAATDNIAKDATTGNFSLDASGVFLRIEASGLTGDCLAAWGTLYSNASGTDVTAQMSALTNDIILATRNSTTSVTQDLTALVDIGTLSFHVFYVTSA